MSFNRENVGDPPTYVVCDPLSRNFPEGWKDIWFRRYAETANGTKHYTCPICLKTFDHSLIHHLHGDHIWPYSLFGESTWDNYQLICGNCNAAKGNRLNREIRKVLGSGSFRKLIATFLRKQIEADALTNDVILKSILSKAD